MRGGKKSRRFRTLVAARRRLALPGLAFGVVLARALRVTARTRRDRVDLCSLSETFNVQRSTPNIQRDTWASPFGLEGDCKAPLLGLESRLRAFLENNESDSAEDHRRSEKVADCDRFTEKENATSGGEDGNAELNRGGAGGFEVR